MRTLAMFLALVLLSGVAAAGVSILEHEDTCSEDHDCYDTRTVAGADAAGISVWYGEERHRKYECEGDCSNYSARESRMTGLRLGAGPAGDRTVETSRCEGNETRVQEPDRTRSWVDHRCATTVEHGALRVVVDECEQESQTDAREPDQETTWEHRCKLGAQVMFSDTVRARAGQDSEGSCHYKDGVQECEGRRRNVVSVEFAQALDVARSVVRYLLDTLLGATN